MTDIVPVPEVVLASEFPTPADRVAGEFNQKAKAWADSENAMVTRSREIALATHTNAIATTEQAQAAEQHKDDAAQFAQDAAAQVALAEAAADAAASTVGAEQWVSGKTYAAGEAVWSPVDMQTYRRRVAGAGAIDPSLDPAAWALIGGATEGDIWAATLAI